MSANYRLIRNSMKRIITVMIVLWVGLFISCINHDTSKSLDEVEAILNDQPDSALTLIRAIDTLSLNTSSLKARYSLLYAIALDKNYIDTTDVSVIMPAVNYYDKRGDVIHRFKALYYYGRIQYNSGELGKAAISFSLAESLVSELPRTETEGLLYMAFADIYNKTRNKDKEEEYVEKGIGLFEVIGDIKHLNLSVGRLAIVYYNKQRWDLADSLFRSGMEKAAADSVAMPVFLSNYARMKVVQPKPDPRGSIILLNKMFFNYHQPLSYTDYGVLAYASQLCDDDHTCREIEKMFSALSDEQKGTVSYWMAKIEQNRGNHANALEYYIKSFDENIRLFNDLVSQSVTQTLQDYYEQSAISAEKDGKIALLRSIIVSIVIILVIVFCFLYARKVREKKHAEVERLLKIAEESNKILQQANASLISKNRAFEQERSVLQVREMELEETLDALRKSYAATYKEKFAAIGELCNTYIESQKRTDMKDMIFRRVERLIAYISDDDKLHKKFENQINKDLNNIVKHLKSDLGDIDKKDSRFICYCLVGFDPEMIGTILGLSLSNVYTKKSRLKDRIRGLDSPYKEEYLRML